MGQNSGRFKTLSCLIIDNLIATTQTPEGTCFFQISMKLYDAPHRQSIVISHLSWRQTALALSGTRYQRGDGCGNRRSGSSHVRQSVLMIRGPKFWVTFVPRSIENQNHGFCRDPAPHHPLLPPPAKTEDIGTNTPGA